jgi:hypothetical protein
MGKLFLKSVSVIVVATFFWTNCVYASGLSTVDRRLSTYYLAASPQVASVGKTLSDHPVGARLLAGEAIVEGLGIDSVADIVKNMQALTEEGVKCFISRDESGNTAKYIIEDGAILRKTPKDKEVADKFYKALTLLGIQGKIETIDTETREYIYVTDANVAFINSVLALISNNNPEWVVREAIRQPAQAQAQSGQKGSRELAREIIAMEDKGISVPQELKDALYTVHLQELGRLVSGRAMPDMSTDDEVYSLMPPASETKEPKYNEAGEAQYFDGITTVVNVPLEHSLHKLFKKIVEKINLWQNTVLGRRLIAFVKEESAHITMYDGLTRRNWKKKFNEQLNDETKEEIEERAQAILAEGFTSDIDLARIQAAFEIISRKFIEGIMELNILRSPRFKPYGVSVRLEKPKLGEKQKSVGINIIMAPESAEDLIALTRMQEKLAEKTGIQNRGNFIGHITMGYLVNTLSIDEYKKFREFVNDLNSSVQEVTNDRSLVLEAGDVIASFFYDMESFPEIISAPWVRTEKTEPASFDQIVGRIRELQAEGRKAHSETTSQTSPDASIGINPDAQMRSGSPLRSDKPYSKRGFSTVGALVMTAVFCIVGIGVYVGAPYLPLAWQWFNDLSISAAVGIIMFMSYNFLSLVFNNKLSRLYEFIVERYKNVDRETVVIKIFIAIAIDIWILLVAYALSFLNIPLNANTFYFYAKFIALNLTVLVAIIIPILIIVVYFQVIVILYVGTSVCSMVLLMLSYPGYRYNFSRKLKLQSEDRTINKPKSSLPKQARKPSEGQTPSPYTHLPDGKEEQIARMGIDRKGELSEIERLSNLEKLAKILGVDINDVPSVVREKLQSILDELKRNPDYGVGIFGAAREIVLVDNLGGIDSDLKENGLAVIQNGVIAIDIDAFRNDVVLKDVVLHELWHSILETVESNPAIAEATAIYQNLKVFSEMPEPEQRALIAFLMQADNGLQSQSYADVLQNIADRKITGDGLIALAINYIMTEKRYSSIAESVERLADREIKRAEEKLGLARDIYTDIAKAMTALEPAITKVKHADTNAKAIMKIKMLFSSMPVRETGFIEALIEKNKYMRLYVEDLQDNPHIIQWLQRVLNGKENSPFQFSSRDGKDVSQFLKDNNLKQADVPENVSRNLIDVPEIMFAVNKGLSKDSLSLPIVYSVSGIYLAGQVVLADGNIAQLKDKDPLSYSTLMAMYKALFGSDFTQEMLSQMIFGMLPKIVPISESIEAMRRAISEIEKAA